MAEKTTVFARGAFNFEVTKGGDLVNSATNVETLRQLWLHRAMIQGADLGPGDRGDFDRGAWHVACHLAGAGGVRRAADGRKLWLEISHDHLRDDYFASVTAKEAGVARTVRLDSAEGRRLHEGSKLLGFVEGNSTGRISAREVNDPPSAFNLWRRQDFDQPVTSTSDGGKVWEHWCTQRDIRPESRIGTAVLTAYVSLAAALGDQFAPTVARGRRDYGHPIQLAALVEAGFTSRSSALWKITPQAIPDESERLFLEADPALSLEAVELMTWTARPAYYMFRRRITHWNPVDKVGAGIRKFTW